MTSRSNPLPTLDAPPSPGPAAPAETPAHLEARPPEPAKAREPEKGRDKKARRERKLLRKAEKAARDAHRPLDSWERYRALVDAFEDATDLIDLADHKARFALVIMGALNAVLFIVATRSEFASALPAGLWPWAAAYLVAYVLVALYFFMQAIESLRPRKAHPHIPYPGEGALAEHPVGLRFYEDILERDLAAYRRAWGEVQIGQINNEVAVQVHGLARINQAKYLALRRLYAGLQLMTLMAGVALSVLAYFALVDHADGALAGQLAPGRAPGWAGLPAPEVTEAGVKEASGVAWHAGLGRLFVVGDQGRLAEFDPSGDKRSSAKPGGNLEDLVEHPPTGLLILLSEKKGELLAWDPATRRATARWPIEAAAVLGQEPRDRNQGFEGLAFRPEAGRPGGGVFYLVHQRAPALVVAIAFDPSRPPAALGASAVVTRFALPPHQDLTAASWVPSLGRLLVVSDQDDRLMVVAEGGTIEAELALPGLRQEGLALDGRGDLWVADDRGGLLRFRGGLAIVETAARAPALPAPGPS
jgi:uncharacterized protein YjiK